MKLGLKRAAIITIVFLLAMVPALTVFAEEIPVEDPAVVETPAETPAEAPMQEISELPVVTTGATKDAVEEALTTEPIAEAQLAEYPANSIEGFVIRMYQATLNRYPDPTGLAEWSALLRNKTLTGAKYAEGMIGSQEFQSKSLTSSEYVQIMYRAFFGREADPGGLTAWVNVLNDGYSRRYVMKGFIDSQEFTIMCNQYGIERGTIEITKQDMPVDRKALEAFVTRLYELCLGRPADPAGLASWVDPLAKGQTTGAQVAYGFIFSQEFVTKRVSNDVFVEIMYKSFFNRAADPAGFKAWMLAIDKGEHRQNIMAGFVNSDEYNALCKTYNIDRGTLPKVNAPLPKPIAGTTLKLGHVNRTGSLYVDFTITPVHGVTGYEIYRADNNDLNNAKLMTASAKTTWRDTEVLAGHKYYYAVEPYLFVNDFQCVAGPIVKTSHVLVSF